MGTNVTKIFLVLNSGSSSEKFSLYEGDDEVCSLYFVGIEEDGKKKDFGYIVDYANVQENLDTALAMYNALEGFDPEDLEGLLTDVSEQVDKLPQLRSNLWDVFKGVKNNG